MEVQATTRSSAGVWLSTTAPWRKESPGAGLMRLAEAVEDRLGDGVRQRVAHSGRGVVGPHLEVLSVDQGLAGVLYRA